jgi:hypothetical protein
MKVSRHKGATVIATVPEAKAKAKAKPEAKPAKHHPFLLRTASRIRLSLIFNDLNRF